MAVEGTGKRIEMRIRYSTRRTEIGRLKVRALESSRLMRAKGGEELENLCVLEERVH